MTDIRPNKRLTQDSRRRREDPPDRARGVLWRADQTGTGPDHGVDSTPFLNTTDEDRERSAVPPIWLSYSDPPFMRLLMSTVLAVAFGGSLVGVHYLNQQDDEGAIGLLGMGAVLIMIASFVGCALSLFMLPRALMPLALVVSDEGVEIVQKERLRLRLVRSWLPWAQVRAIVSMPGTANDPTARIEIYLARDAGEWRPPGVGVISGAGRVEHSPRPDIAEVVAFPAWRLHLLYDARTEGRARTTWPAVKYGQKARHGIAYVRPALLTFVPDLCHGFGDLTYDPNDVRRPGS